MDRGGWLKVAIAAAIAGLVAWVYASGEKTH